MALGMTGAAHEELDAVDADDQLTEPVLLARIDLYAESRQWDALVAVAGGFSARWPASPHGWIGWAYGLRELGKVSDARSVLADAEPLHVEYPLLHYNLACYACLLGDIPEAKRRLAIACKAEAAYKEMALDDEDLRAMWEDIGAGS